jgi:hypothetical protein
MNSEDILVWADGTWCYAEELEEMNHMSDDFAVLPVDSEPYNQFLFDLQQ